MPLLSGNLFDALNGERLDDLSAETIEILAAAPGARVERIVSTGQGSPDGFWYDQAEDEFVVVLQGAAALAIEGEDDLLEMKAGDWTLIPARRRHRVASTSEAEPTVWLAVHLAA